jgi:hypothetical protein
MPTTGQLTLKPARHIRKRTFATQQRNLKDKEEIMAHAKQKNLRIRQIFNLKI